MDFLYIMYNVHIYLSPMYVLYMVYIYKAIVPDVNIRSKRRHKLLRTLFHYSTHTQILHHSQHDAVNYIYTHYTLIYMRLYTFHIYVHCTYRTCVYSYYERKQHSAEGCVNRLNEFYLFRRSNNGGLGGFWMKFRNVRRRRRWCALWLCCDDDITYCLCIIFIYSLKGMIVVRLRYAEVYDSGVFSF